VVPHQLSAPAAGSEAAAVPPWDDEVDENWADLIDEVVRDPRRLELVFQPIVSLQAATVVGYETLSRFPVEVGQPPDRWFAAADALGRGAEVEAIVLSRCLALRETLPPNCFLTVNVSPHLLTEPVLADLLLGAGDLSPLILELTEHQQVSDLTPLVSLRDQLAAQGALVALDDAGSGYSGLQQMTRLRPHLIKLDRALVADADRDEVKRALAELLGEFAGRIDAWLLAEGVETWAELEAFLQLRVPLAQGYLLGRPAPPWATLHPQTATRLRASAARAALTDHVASLIESVPVEGTDPVLPDQVGLRLDRWGRPAALLIPWRRLAEDGREGHRVSPVSLRVSLSTSVVDVAQRLVSRPPHCRFDPVVCVDELGRAVGIIHLERILLQLARVKVASSAADTH
jgi:EAL domain-containing protein (putative c-di-GMP-specific phosphodiesterase class I)